MYDVGTIEYVIKSEGRVLARQPSGNPFCENMVPTQPPDFGRKDTFVKNLFSSERIFYYS